MRWLACSQRGAASAAQQARSRGAGRRGSKVRTCVHLHVQLRTSSSNLGSVESCGSESAVVYTPFGKAKRKRVILVHACHGAGGSEGTRLLLAGQVRAQEGRQATRARGALRRGQCWIRWNVGRAAGVQAQSAQGMGAQKRGAAPPLGSGKARGVGVRRRGAAQHSTMVRVGIRAPVPW